MSMRSISATLGQADREAVMAAVATIKEKLPFLIDLSVEERKALPKMGDKSRAFVSKALEVAAQNSDFLPRSFDIPHPSFSERKISIKALKSFSSKRIRGHPTSQSSRTIRDKP